MADVLIEKSGAVATVTLNRPQSLNAVTPAMAEEIEELAMLVNRDDEVRVVVMRGAGERAFCVGSDIKALPQYETAWHFRNRASHRPVNYGFFGPKVMKPVIAMIHGYCLGGGLEIALNCDLRTSSEDAEFGAPEVTWGWIGGGSASQLLPRLVGYGRAFELLALGERISATAAYEWGMLNRLVPRAQLETVTYELAQRLAEQPPIAVQVIKQAVRYAMNTALDVGRLVENELVWGTFTTEDKEEGVRAFVEKRRPQYRGR